MVQDHDVRVIGWLSILKVNDDLPSKFEAIVNLQKLDQMIVHLDIDILYNCVDQEDKGDTPHLKTSPRHGVESGVTKPPWQ